VIETEDRDGVAVEILPGGMARTTLSLGHFLKKIRSSLAPGLVQSQNALLRAAVPHIAQSIAILGSWLLMYINLTRMYMEVFNGNWRDGPQKQAPGLRPGQN
jgi:hypothetical protein